MKKESLIVLSIFVLALFPGCTQNAVKKELLSLLESPGTAKGSDLMLVLCGWPAYEKLQPDAVDIDLVPGSGLRDGSGTAGITARNGSITCSGKIEFTYSPVYMGGHGSGGMEIGIGPMRRVDPLPSAISDPPGSRWIRIGETIAGNLSESGTLLPDGSQGDYYNLDIDKPDFMIRIRLEGEKGLNPKGCLYQDKKLVSTFISFQFGESPSTFNVISVDKGKTVLLVTANKKKGRYTITVEEPDKATRAMMSGPRR